MPKFALDDLQKFFQTVKKLHTHLAYSLFKELYLFIGDDRDRTGNLRLAKPALSQLSYVPEPTH